jgi:hypothetical protein
MSGRASWIGPTAVAVHVAAVLVGVMSFTPAMRRDQIVPVWVSIPMTFQVQK